MRPALTLRIHDVRRRADNLPSIATTAFKAIVVLLFAIGVLSRVSPLFDIDGRLFWQHMSEDGYLMQTIARNMAIGLGMSTAEGTIPTNGVQPLAAFVFAGLHWLADGSRTAGIAWVTAWSALVAVGTLWAGYRVGAHVFAGWRHGRALALISAALWFVAPRITAHSMNGLETGLYYLVLLFTWSRYLDLTEAGRPPLTRAQRVGLGLLLGLTFLARNDAVFFVGALLLAHTALGEAGAARWHRVRDSLVAGVTCLLTASPWLVHNGVRFGSIVPISGSAQSRDVALGDNLPLIPVALFEAAWPHFPMPASMEGLPAVQAVGLVAFAVSVIGFGVYAAGRSIGAKRFYATGLIFTGCLVAYYGVVFGAAHFLSRYTSSTSPFLWLCSTATVFALLNLAFGTVRGVRVAGGAVVALMLVCGAGMATKNFVQGRNHEHKQVVDWALAHVSPVHWIGAEQTGTLGFFFDRTLNLDGKVNPEALKVLRREGHILNYVLDSKVDYIVDWYGMDEWVRHPHLSERFGREFEVVVADAERNLAALQRVALHPATPAK